MSNHISEIIPDMKDLPDWARDAFEDGQFFNVTFEKIAENESLRAELKNSNAEFAKLNNHYGGQADEIETLTAQLEAVRGLIPVLTLTTNQLLTNDEKCCAAVAESCKEAIQSILQPKEQEGA